nr:hypothetical protein [Tanacetum cinerariifolium]
MLLAHEVAKGDADEVHGEDVNAGDTAEGDVSAANDEVPTADEEPFIPSTTPPPQPSLDIHSTSQIDQALEITKLKQRVKKLERKNKVKVLKLRRIIANMDADADVVLEEAKEVTDDAKADQDVVVKENVLSMQGEESEPTELQEVVDIVTTTKLITEVVTAASTTITAADVPVHAATTAAAPTLTAAPSRRTKGVVIRDPEETTTTSTIIHTEAKSKDKGKGILVEDPKPLKKSCEKEDKRRSYCEKMDYFKGMSYDDMCPIFEVKFDSNVAFLQKIKEQINEEESRALKRINKTPAKKASKRQKLDEDVEELKRHLKIVPNEEDEVYTEATPLAQDLEALWSLVKEQFATTKPKNFSDDFLLITLGAMFEKPDIHAQISKNQRSAYCPAKVKSRKLLESCGLQIIQFTTIQLVLLVERKYPLTRFTLDQMLNVVRLEVEEDSEVSLELLRFIQQQHQEGAQLE